MANHCRQRQDSNSVEGKTGWQINAGRDRISIQYRGRWKDKSLQEYTGWQFSVGNGRMAIYCNDRYRMDFQCRVRCTRITNLSFGPNPIEI
jgi:hypothetical protein